MTLRAVFTRGIWSITRSLGLDRAIFYTVLSRGWSALAGPVTLIFVARFLSAEEQGFFYIFGSLLALQVYFELGLSSVIMQAVSHEKAHLDWSSAGTLVGDSRAKARLASIFRLALKWYFVVGLLIFGVLMVAGFAFFGANEPAEPQIAWRAPWMLLVCVCATAMVLTPLYGLLDGCGKVAELSAVAVWQAIVGSVLVWLGLAAGWKLYAAPLITVAAVVIGLVYILKKQRRALFLDLIKTHIPSDDRVSWRQEILPFQWKISVSWLSGFFIFQLTSPFMFRFHGAAEAGRMGMTMRIVDSIMVLGVAWVATKRAPFGTYIARRDFVTLDRIFAKASWQSAGVVLLGGFAFMGLYYILRANGVTFIQRLLDPIEISFLLANALVGCVIMNQATYLRAHKQEPFLGVSLVGAGLVVAVLFFLGRPFGALGITAGLFAGGLCVSLPLATIIFYKKRREWHQDA